MSETTNLKLFKHDNPETNTNQFDVNKSLNENWDKIDKTVGQANTKIATLEKDNTTNKTDISSIKTEQTSQNTELEQLKFENERLKQDLSGLPVGTVEGENVDLTDSAEMRFSEFNVRGNSVQDGEPTPDNPVEDESCGDNVNLFDKDNYTNAFLNVNTGVIDSTSSWVSSWKITDYIEINSTILTLSFELLKNSTSTSWNIKFGFYDKDKNFISGIGEQIPSSKSYDVPVNTKYIKFNYTVVDYIESIKIEKGKTATPSYSEYGQGCINEVICNENLFNGQMESGGYDNTNGVKTVNAGLIRNSNPIFVTPNTEYIISNDGVGYTINVLEYKKDGTFIGRYNNNAVQANETYIASAETGFINIYKGNTYYDKMQIEKGSKITNYVKHQSQTLVIPTQQPMRSVGDVRDTFVMKNNKWYERHNVGRLVLDGTESFRDVAIGNEINYFSLGTALSDYYYIDDNTLNYICNYFKGIKTVNRYQDNTFFINAGKNIVMCTNSFTTTTEFKAWLAEQYNAGTPVYVDYVLNTPNDIECTEEQSAILDEIENTAKSYKGITHIYSTDEVGAVVEVTYKKDIEALFNALARSGV